jgi:hypothetical protein
MVLTASAGREAKPHEELKDYFTYMKAHEDRLWIAPFRDATKYMRERMAAKTDTKQKDNEIVVTLTHSLDKDLYNYPLTLKTYLPDGWSKVRLVQGGDQLRHTMLHNEYGTYVQYDAVPNGEEISIASN